MGWAAASGEWAEGSWRLAHAFWEADAVLFLLSVLLLAAVWLGYPLAVAIWAKWRPDHAPARVEQEPVGRVSVIVAAHNEAAHIEARIRNLWEQDYPREAMELLIAEDGSSDATAALVRQLQPFAPYPLRLLSAPRRTGKAAAINRAAEAANGDILVFSDANNTYTRSTIRALAAPFADPEVGAVTGLKSVASSVGLGNGESLYFRYEAWLAGAESRTGGTVASFGEVLAVRRSSFRPLPPAMLINDDMALVLGVLARRQRVVVAPGARSFEYGAAGAAAEWVRRRRMTAGRLGALAHALRTPAEGGAAENDARPRLRHWVRQAGWAASLKLLFHEGLRPVSAWALILALFTGAAGLFAPAAAFFPPLRLLAWLQAAAWGLVALVALQRSANLRLGRAGQNRAGRALARSGALYFFCLAQLAALDGCWQYWRRRPTPLWQRARRATAESGAAAGPEPGGAALSPPPMNNRQILRGLFWASSSFVLGKLFVFASIVVLARMLAPRAFGEVALATSAILMLEVFGTLGLTSALIFEDQDPEAAAGICFWATVTMSLLEVAAGWRFVPWVADFFHEPGLTPMLRVLAIALVLAALGNTHDTLLRRRLSFRRKLIPDLGQAGVKGVACVVLALLGWGAWSLIWGQVLGAAVCTFLLWQVTPWRPRRAWDRRVAARMFAYAKHIYLLDTSSALLTNLDTLTIGRMLSDAWLGFYTLAFRVPEVLLISVLNVITRVVFPAFSRLQGDRATLRRTVLDTIRYTALLTTPLAAAMAILARPLVYGIYGRHWGPAIPVLQVLALYAGIRCLTHHFGDAYKAIGRPDILTRVTTLWWILLPPDLILGAHWGGIVGVAWGHVVTRCLISLLHLVLIARFLDIHPAALWRTLAPALEATGAMSAGLLLVDPALANWNPRAELAVIVPFGVAVYFLFLRLRHPAVLDGAVGQVRQFRTRRTGAGVPGADTAAAAAAVPAAPVEAASTAAMETMEAMEADERAA